MNTNTPITIKKPVAPVTVPPKKKKTGNKAEYDVRISVHTSSRKRGGVNEKNGVVMFNDSLYELFVTNVDTDRIELRKVEKRLYFKVNTYGKRGDGTSCICSPGKLQYSRKEQVELLEQFIGEYSLEYDVKKNTYYVDLDKRTDLANTPSGTYNVPHNYGAKRPGDNFRGISEKDSGFKEKVDVVEMEVTDVQPADPDVKLEAKSSGNADALKTEIFQLLDVLGSDKSNTYAVALVNLIKEKVTAL